MGTLFRFEFRSQRLDMQDTRRSEETRGLENVIILPVAQCYPAYILQRETSKVYLPCLAIGYSDAVIPDDRMLRP